MRVIKLYEQFVNENNNNNKDNVLVENIRDIFVELIDIGFYIGIQDRVGIVGLEEKADSIIVFIESSKQFNCSDIKEPVMMFLDYLGTRFMVKSVEYDFYIYDIERDNPLATDKICKQVYKNASTPYMSTPIFPDDVIVETYITVEVKVSDLVKVQESIGSVDDYIVRNIRDIFVEYQDKKALSVQVKKVSNISLYSTHLWNSKIPRETPVFGQDSYVVELYSNLGIKYDEISEYIDVLIDYINSLTDNEVSITYRINRIKILDYNGNFIAKEHTSSEGIPMWGYDPTWIKMVEFFFKEEETLKVQEANKWDPKIVVDPNIVSNIEDIFVELVDQGINVMTQCWNDTGIHVTLIPDENKNKYYFNCEIADESIKMLIDYMDSKFGSSKVTYCAIKVTKTGKRSPDISENLLKGLTDELTISFKFDEPFKLLNESNIERGDKCNITDELDAAITDIFVELRDEGIEVCTQSWNPKIIYVTLTPFDYTILNYFNCLIADEAVKMLIDYMELQFGDSFVVNYTTHERDFSMNNPGEVSILHYDHLPNVNTDELSIEFIFDEPYTYINESFGTLSSEDYDKIEADMKDIFIDWTDNGADCDINFYHKGVGYGVGREDYLIKVRFYYDKGFVPSDIEEDVKMLYDYISNLTDKKVLLEYQLDNDRTNTRRSGTDFSPYGFANEVDLYFIESAYKDVSESEGWKGPELHRTSFFEDRERIIDNINHIFTEYKDLHDLSIDIEFNNQGIGLPSTLMSYLEHVLEVKLFAQRGISYSDMLEEIGMLIDYIKSLTDKEIRIFYDLDKSGLRNWRPLAGNTELEQDYYLSNCSRVFNTIKLYFVG